MRLMSLSSIKKLTQTALLVLCFTMSWSASAGLLSVNGTTIGGATWNRPNAGNPPDILSVAANDVAYDVFAFQVSANGDYDFLSKATNPIIFDNYLFLYQIAFNPLDQFANIIIGNDDFVNIVEAGFNAVTLSSGITYFAVTTGFSNSDAGDYTLTISSNDGTAREVTEAPEPSSLMLFAIALLGAGLSRRRLNKA